MKALAVTICIVMFLKNSAVADMAGECNMAGFYLELGCTPAEGATEPCPNAFKCPDLHPDPTMCYYRGAAYGDRTTIPQNLINNPCSQACSCQVSVQARFECAAVDCFQTFDSDSQQCVLTHQLDECCSVGSICGKDAVAKLKTCEIDSKTYREGETFEPKNSRKICICTSNWNGSIDNPEYCRDINCGIELHYQQNILENCAPVFFGNERSCPISFECPNKTTKVIRGLNLRNISNNCVFGNMTLSAGDEVTAEDKCTRCACNVPPFVSCTKTNSCDE